MSVAPRERLHIDPELETSRIAAALRQQVGAVLGRRGLVVAMSGGIDSSVCAGLAVRAVGADRVLGLMLPERESDPASLELARTWADALKIEHLVEHIAPVLEACGCYQRRDAAIARVVPGYGPGWRSKLVLPGDRLDSDRLNITSLAVQPPDGTALREVRLPPAEYRQIVAATNFKQRVRKMLEYYHADRLHYAVVGTPNRLEYDQGFFVKGGDGLADVKPIAHLYKTQVYQLAAYLGVPADIQSRPPTTDTFSLPQSQEEFYFALPAKTLDLVLSALNDGRPSAAVGAELGYRPDQIDRAFRDIEQKRATTRYLHFAPLLVEPVPQVNGTAPQKALD
ncbi:MAG TPA: NAD(+) synthase [Gemmatimonadales bacterium]|nr:NAD(+) synthase [Gemmatimonadales bacterium]